MIADMLFALTRVSKNDKTGPIATVVISECTCSPDCPYAGSGCYADLGPLGVHWNKVSKGERGVGFREFLKQLVTLPMGSLWRYAVAGDLPGKGSRINRKQLRALVKANAEIKGKGFTYTHKPPLKWTNAEAIMDANENGFTVNLSSNNVAHADELMALELAPVVTIVPSDTGEVSEKRDRATGKMKAVRKWISMDTPAGHRVVQCPAEYRGEIQCINCGSGSPLCQRSDRKFIVGFTVHGQRKSKANMIARGLPIIKD